MAPGRLRQRWTAAETRIVVEADPATATIVELAEQLDRTPQAVRGQRDRIMRILRGHPPGPGDAVIDETLRELGYYDRERRDRLNLAQPLPWAKAEPSGRTADARRWQQWTAAETIAVIQATPETTTILGLAERLNRTPETVLRHRDRVMRVLRGYPPNGVSEEHVEDVLRSIGYLDLPRRRRLSLAQPLPWSD